MIKRFIVDDAGSLIDLETGSSYDYFEECIELINSINHERVDNKRKLNTLKHRLKKIIN